MTISINGETIDAAAIAEAAAAFGGHPDPVEAAARTLAVRALLRQRARAAGIVAADEAAAIEALLEREVAIPEVGDDECRRVWAGHRARYRSGDLFEVRHILLRPTEEETPAEFRERAEDTLHAARRRPQDFDALARRCSVCPSAAQDGRLGQVARGSVLPEFWHALVAFGRAGVLPDLVATRHGLHVVCVDRAAPGEELPFAAVAAQIRGALRERLAEMAYRRYVSALAAGARIEGVDLLAANAPTMH